MPNLPDISQLQAAILGTVCLSYQPWFDIKGLVHPNMFDGSQRELAEFLWERNQQQQAYDLNLLKAKFSAPLIDSLIKSQTGPDMLQEHARLLHDSYMASKEQELSLQLQSDVKGGKSFNEAYAQKEGSMELLRSLFTAKQDRAAVFTKALDSVRYAMENPGITGVPSGIAGMDEFTNGFQKGTMYVLGARPNMGKTTLMATIVDNQITLGYNPIIFSLGDGSKNKLIVKIACIRVGIAWPKVRDGKITKEEYERIEQAISQMYESGIQIYDIKDMPGKKVSQMTEHIRDLQRNGNQIDMVWIDYFQQINPDDKRLLAGTNQAGEQIAEAIQYMSIMLDLPVFAFSQLNRQVEIRGGAQRARLSDFRGSGGIEQAARTVFALYRPEYYNILEDEEGMSLKGVTEVLILKDDVRGKPSDDSAIRLQWRDERLQGYQEEDSQPSPAPQAESTLIVRSRSARMNDDDDIPF